MGVTNQVAALLRQALVLLETAQPQDAEISYQGAREAHANLQSEDRRPIAWGSKVSPVFRERVWWIADTLGLDPDDLMACMAWESAESFRPDIRNAAGSGATGLIQFMPSTAVSLGTSTAKLAKMTAEDQLNYVYKYFRPYAGRLNNLGDIYMAILWPAGVGKSDEYVLWNKSNKPTTYRQNAGLDINKDQRITRGECLVKIKEKLAKGKQPRYMG